MELHTLKPAPGSVRGKRRIARGQGSGRGGTATRGHKGAKSRSGYKRKRNFEGGQMPLQMRLPKRGFNNISRKVFVPVNLDRLQEIADKYDLDTISPEVLVEKGILRKHDRVKILATGELTTKLTISAHACSASAKQHVEAVGGSINLV